METLQLAQMLADLSDLDAAEPSAAHALVTANAAVATTTSTLSSTTARPTTQSPTKPTQHRRASSSSALSPATRNGGASTPFDSYLGRRLLTPSISRSSSSHGSMPGTPRGNETDSDIDRASSLMALYDLRAKLKQYNDSNSLRQAREKVAALSGRQQPLSHPPPDSVAPGTPQPPPIARRHSQYKFPKS